MTTLDFEVFANILFDKETREQFLKECEELGITDGDSKGADDGRNVRNVD